jgi:hypothetical protein
MNNLKLIAEIKKNLNKIIEINDSILDSLPDELKAQTATIKEDIKNVTEAVKEGNLSKLNAIKERYANHTNKQ